MSDFSDFINFVQMTPDIATSGQPDEKQLPRIAEAGYRVVINLAMPDSDRALADEGSRVAATGMRYLHIPVDFKNPTTDDLRTFIRAMRMFEGERVWVHCAVNARVSAFMYHYLRNERGLDEAACRSPVLDKWAPRMDDVWKRFLALTPAEIAS